MGLEEMEAVVITFENISGKTYAMDLGRPQK
jgi:hypothetical protein